MSFTTTLEMQGRFSSIFSLLFIFITVGCSNEQKEKPRGGEPLSRVENAVVCSDDTDCSQITTLPPCQKYKCVGGGSTGNLGICQPEPDDSLSCTYSDKCKTGICLGGSCVAGTSKNCDNGNPCDGAETCNPATGACSSLGIPPGVTVSCDDNNSCTNNDTCISGACKGTVISFDDGNPCNGIETCLHGVKVVDIKTIPKDKTPCDDGNACTTKDVCLHKICAGTLKKVDDNNACTIDTCDTATGKAIHTRLPNIDDGLVCTKDNCDRRTGAISHLYVDVDDGNPCTEDFCSEENGVYHTAVSVPTACDDGDTCTEGDHCSDKKCVGVSQVTEACGFVPPEQPANPLVGPIERGETASVGSLAGSFSVTQDGAATYSIPFALPPGRAGMTPGLGLNYSSDSGNGLVGMGFSITGLSSIHRCPANLAVHNYIKEVDYENDELCLDGKPLRKVGNAQAGYSPNEFRTFPDSFLKIVGHFGSNPNQFSWFEVRDRSGMIHFYGWDGQNPETGARPLASNGNVQRWQIYRSSDRFGNSINFTYEQQLTSSNRGQFPYSKENYISKISYPPNNLVLFTYEDRPDSRDFWSKGMLFSRTKRLSRVDTFVATTSVRSYDIVYDDEPGFEAPHPSQRSRVSRIAECVGTGGAAAPICKPNTIFTWNQGAVGFSPSVNTGATVDSTSSIIFPLDVDRDGRDDLVFPDTKTIVSCHEDLDKGTGFCGPGKECLQAGCAQSCDPSAPIPCPEGLECLPVYGYYCVPPGGANFNTTEYVYTPKSLIFLRSNGGAVARDPSLGSDFNIKYLSSSLPLDFNGDRNQDILLKDDYRFGFLKPDDSLGNYYTVVVGPKYNQIKSLKIPRPTENDPNSDFTGATHFADLDGNGFPDLIQCWGQTSAEVNDSHWTYRLHSGLPNPEHSYKESVTVSELNGVKCKNASFPMDINGDGISEYLINSNDGLTPVLALRLAVNNPFGTTGQDSWQFPTEVVSTNLYLPNAKNIPIIADVNGDGLKDIIVTTPAPEESKFALGILFNNGNGFLPVSPFINGEFTEITPGLLALSLVVDFNGDGLDDLLVPNFGTPASLASATWDAFISNGRKFDVSSTDIRFEGRAPVPNDNDPSTYLSGDDRIKYQNFRAFDADGDGVPDLIGVSNTEPGLIITRKSKLFEEDTLKNIDNGLNYKSPDSEGYVPNITINYAHLIDHTEVYKKGNSDPLSVAGAECSSNPDIDCVAGPKRVVGSYSINNGHGLLQEPTAAQQNKFSLSYEDARYFKPGRQWLGFAKRTIRQEISGSGGAAPGVSGAAPGVDGETSEIIRIRDEYYDNTTIDGGIYPLAGRLKRAVSITKGKNSPHTYAEENWTYGIKRPSDFKSPLFVYTKDYVMKGGDAPSSNVFSTDTLNPIIHKSSESHVHFPQDVDNFGNIIRSTQKSDSLTTTVENSYSNDVEEWLIGRQTTSVVCQSSTDFSDSNGCVATSASYDSKGYPLSIIVDPFDPTQWIRTSFWRDAYGNVSGVVTQDNSGKTRKSWVFYDDQGLFPSARQNSLGHTSFEQYDPTLGTLVRALDPNGVPWKAVYDGFGRLTRTVSPDGNTTDVARERSLDPSQNWLTKVHTTSSLGLDNTQLFNNVGQPLSTAGVGFGQNLFYKAYGYDELGENVAKESLIQKSSQQSPPNYQQIIAAPEAYSYKYDFAGRILQAKDPDQLGTTYLYDPQGQSFIIPPKDENGFFTKTSDKAGRLTSVVDPSGGTTSYVYGAFGSVRVVAPGDSLGTILQTDRRGRIIFRQDPNRGIANYKYNAFGDVVQEYQGTNADNIKYISNYKYDELGRVIEKTVEDSESQTQETTKWIWDQATHGLGKISQIVSNDNHREYYHYDEFGRVELIVTRPNIKNSNGKLTSYRTRLEYKNGRLDTITYPRASGEPELLVHHEYSNEGLLVGLYTSSGNSTQQVWTWKDVDERGRMNLEETGNGLQNSYDFNSLNGLLEHIKTKTSAGTELQHYEYFYDANRNLSSQEDKIHNQKEDFKHDSLDRLIEAKISDLAGIEKEQTRFDYHPNGNIKAIWKPSPNSQGPPPQTWTYHPNHPHAVQQAFRDGFSYTFDYDQLGRQVRRSASGATGTTKYVGYTSFNKPKWISPTDAADPDAVKFSYDGNDQRIIKESAAERTIYINGLYEKTTGKVVDLSTVRRHISNGSRVVATVVHTEGFVQKPSGTKRTWTAQTKYTHSDRLGSPTLITNESGAVEEYRSYDAFGRRRNATDWTLAPPSLKSPLTSGFTGHEDDDELGLVNMQGRIYDPIIARFLTPDPFVQDPSFSQSWNRYSYVFNSPLNFVDPSGFAGDCPPNTSCYEPQAQVTVTFSGPEKNQSTIGDENSLQNHDAAPPNQDNPFGSSSKTYVDIDINSKYVIKIGPTTDKYNPHTAPGRVGSDIFGGPPTPSPLLSPEQDRIIGKAISGGIQLLPGASTALAFADENSTAKDIAFAMAGDVGSLIGANLAVKTVSYVLKYAKPAKFAGKISIALGVNKGESLPKFAAKIQQTHARPGERILYWQDWYKQGLTTTKDTGNFDQFFLEAAKNADTIHFDISKFDRTILKAIEDGERGFTSKNFTNREIYLLFNNKELWEKTILHF